MLLPAMLTCSWLGYITVPSSCLPSCLTPQFLTLSVPSPPEVFVPTTLFCFSPSVLFWNQEPIVSWSPTPTSCSRWVWRCSGITCTGSTSSSRWSNASTKPRERDAPRSRHASLTWATSTPCTSSTWGTTVSLSFRLITDGKGRVTFFRTHLFSLSLQVNTRVLGITAAAPTSASWKATGRLAARVRFTWCCCRTSSPVEVRPRPLLFRATIFWKPEKETPYPETAKIPKLYSIILQLYKNLKHSFSVRR